MNEFNFSSLISDFATRIDDIDKSSLDPDKLRLLTLFIDAAHDTAQTLAGDRAVELYASHECTDALRKWCSDCIVGTQAAGLSGLTLFDTDRRIAA